MTLASRIGAVLLALTQLGVWGFYAPAHRLMCHSPWLTAKARPQAGCPSHCCGHHHAGHQHSTRPVEHSPSQCPDDESHCGLCAIAVQAMCSGGAPQLLDHLARCEVVAVRPVAVVDFQLASPFESRGPPSV